MGVRRFALVGLPAFVLVVAPAAAQETPDSDGDTIADNSDACPSDHGRGTFTGCPRVTPRLTGRWRNTSRGLRVSRAQIDVLPGTRVAVSCAAGTLGFISGGGGACPPRREFRSDDGRPILLTNLAGRTLKRGHTIIVSASRPGSIGAYALYGVARRGLDLYDRRCTEPESESVEPVCDGVGSGVQPSEDDPDGDALAGSSDRCPELHGDGALTGCREALLDWSFRGTASGGQLRLSRLRFDVFAESRVEAQCSASTTCPRRAIRREAFGGVFRQYQGLLVPSGTVIEVRASAPGAIGRYVRFVARGARLSVTERCMEPGSRIPSEGPCTGRSVDDPPEPPLTPWLNPYPFVEVQGGRFRGGVYLRGVFVRDVPSAASARFACAGRGCPPNQTVRPRNGVVKFRGFPKQFQRDIRFTVTVEQPSRVGLHAQIVTGSRWPPRRRENCLVPSRRGRPAPCPVRP